jgi:[NiFe] hydrogenase assembly HybE family chaperone
MMLRIHEGDPSAPVASAYRRIERERMAGLPVHNEALEVETVGFQRWADHWLGIVISPWCMSLLLLPGTSSTWIAATENERIFHRFPAGDFAFLGGEEPEIGEYQSCALFSPMSQFASQSDAVLTAHAALLALIRAPEEPASQLAQKALSSPARRKFLTGNA